jgi:6-phosphogluconolactonase
MHMHGRTKPGDAVTVVIMEVVVHETPADAALAVARRISDAIGGSGGRFTLGLSGGSTPIPTYRRLREMSPGWDRVDTWVSDERWVPHDHERSNARMALETLCGPVGATLHRPAWAEDLEPSQSACEFEVVIRSLHADRRPDLIHLGMGDDGHTASLFPGTAALEETERWIVANQVPSQGETRITATYPLLWSARLIIVQVDGAGKAEAVRASLAGETPAGRLGEGEAEVEWHIDRAAATAVS